MFLKMNKITRVQAEKLIDLIKEKPLMYNKADQYYKHLAMKERIWKEIADNVGVDENDCKTAWKSLRDQFVKATKDVRGKSGQEATYKYYKELLFLKDTLQHSKRTHNYDQWTDESDVSAILNVNIKSEEHAFADSERDPIDVMDVTAILDMNIKNEESDLVDDKCDPMDELAFPSSTSTRFSSSPGKRFKRSSNEDECLTTLNSQPQGQNEQFFSCVSIMVDKANLTAVQTRQIQRKVFNFVADELDKIESNK